MTDGTDWTIVALSAVELEAALGELAGLLHDCVAQGAAVNFVLPFPLAASEAFWRGKVLPGVAGGRLLVLVARRAGRIVGSVQLDHDTPPNQPHRAEVRKLLVHPAHRRLGIARALMAEVERRAPGLGRRLLTLDTRTGDMAEPLYRSLGYQVVGSIPGYSRDTIEERYDAATIMYKIL